MWSSVESVRTTVRKVLGVQGDAKRQYKNKSLYREPRMAGVDYFEDLPDGLTEFKDWEPCRVDGPIKPLILSDVHIPFHNPALKVALRHGKKEGCNAVILNGDIIDCHELSKFLKDPRKRVFGEEIRVLRMLMDAIRKEFGKSARIIYKLGNHEERYIHFLIRQAPVFLDIPEFDFKEIMRLDEYGVELVGEKRPIALGKLNVIHGHEYNFPIANPVNAARGFFLRAKSHCLGGHLHQSSQHSEKNIEGLVVSTWSTGCLCDLHPEYRPINSWNHGFAIVNVDKDGSFEVENFRIINGKPYRG